MTVIFVYKISSLSIFKKNSALSLRAKVHLLTHAKNSLMMKRNFQKYKVPKLGNLLRQQITSHHFLKKISFGSFTTFPISTICFNKEIIFEHDTDMKPKIVCLMSNENDTKTIPILAAFPSTLFL